MAKNSNQPRRRRRAATLRALTTVLTDFLVLTAIALVGFAPQALAWPDNCWYSARFAQPVPDRPAAVPVKLGAPALHQSALRPERGMLLVAARKLLDPNFFHTAVFLVDYDANGAIGLVINRPTKFSLPRALPGIAALDGRAELVFVGGPVAKDRMMLLIHSSQLPIGTTRVAGDIHVSSSLETLTELITSGAEDTRFRAFAGYAGWGPGQLEAEIERGDWHLAPADAQLIFDTEPDGIWNALIKRHDGLWVRAFPQRACTQQDRRRSSVHTG